MSHYVESMGGLFYVVRRHIVPLELEGAKLPL